MRGLCLALAVLALLPGCRRDGPEAQVRRAFADCVAAVEAGDPGPLVERMAPEFQGPEGMDRETAKLFLIGVLRQERVGVTVLEAHTQADAREGVQEVQLLLTRRAPGAGLLPQEASRRTFRIRWVVRNGVWQLRELLEQG